jgi:hypothetical protein
MTTVQVRRVDHHRFRRQQQRQRQVAGLALIRRQVLLDPDVADGVKTIIFTALDDATEAIQHVDGE